ncbi:hypothetical protein PSH49_21460 [Pseudoalteromonas sp. GABNS16G]|uniref:hypothetical protein n=1 Tax=unclassified Pseudoalteromonas TaxID=194690 RepID=UPI00235836A1|nr:MULTISPECIES: hypothetical protein [unclassified Pseudoalteromonas]MDC9603149.1 hypothetical protein [Pseudoalteromonas sp. GABNS16G]MDC9611583.1 hypothetical protein [Pseudoalteromonas sp. GABNS16H]
MQLPKRVREGAQLLAEDALIVIGVSLAVVGIVELSGWSSKELLQGYTPLLLAMFSIIVTVSALRLNIKEGRDRALRERNDAVRPILIMQSADSYTHPNAVEKECYVTGPKATRAVNIGLENVGVGIALEVAIFIQCLDGEIYQVAYPISQIKREQKLGIVIRAALPDSINGLVTSYMDIYGNKHYGYYGYLEDEKATNKIYFCEFKDQDSIDVDEVKKALRVSPNSKENYYSFHEFLKKQGLSE